MRTFLAILALSALIAAPVRADVVDSGSLIIGQQGIIGGTMTVQGNALGVAGSVSATSATLLGMGAEIFSLTTSSGIHMVSGTLKLNPGTMIEWGDGSKSTIAASGGGTFSAASTMTIVPRNQSTTQTEFGSCFTSTVAMTTSGGKILISFTGAASNNNATGHWSNLGVLMDGDFITGDDGIKNTSTSAIASMVAPAANFSFNQSFTFLQQAPSAGPHSWCLSGWVSGGTMTIGIDSPMSRMRFSVLELK
ncbi:MAG: hypothetical protein HYZ75_08165 [Elusimicrobia bacterium]|nr:hypothetical protein [Elusimicrobiota bacterium]